MDLAKRRVQRLAFVLASLYLRVPLPKTLVLNKTLSAKQNDFLYFFMSFQILKNRAEV